MDLLHVDDFISAVIAVIDSDFVGTLNLGTGVLTSTHRMARMIADRFGSGSRIEHCDIDADVACIAMDCRVAMREIDWSPNVLLENGLDHILSDTETKRNN